MLFWAIAVAWLVLGVINVWVFSWAGAGQSWRLTNAAIGLAMLLIGTLMIFARTRRHGGLFWAGFAVAVVCGLIGAAQIGASVVLGTLLWVTAATIYPKYR